MQQQASATPLVRTDVHRRRPATVPVNVDLDVTVPAQLQHLPLLRQTAWAFAMRHHARRPDDVRLAVAEATMNAMRYAYPASAPGPVRLHGALADGHVTFEVEDRGCGLWPHPTDGGLGVGIPIIARLADHFAVEDREGAGTRVRMSFEVAPSPAP